ncbi:Fibroblast growth factor 20 [Clarias magur]|uniref:Fibroblast growth factor 20 n=1 Tax=Clarias magur TaxID=1594786 RepID=A0A8J4WS45_CLAMG|nr:Fibroblast growth factor 20 [Clarias magur]
MRFCELLLERPRRSSPAQAGRNRRGQQTDREKVPELLKDLLMFPADRTAGEQDRRQGLAEVDDLMAVQLCTNSHFSPSHSWLPRRPKRGLVHTV